MIEVAHSNLVTLVAGAVLTSALLAFASFEHALFADETVVAALDRLAVEIAGAACSPLHPTASVALGDALSILPTSVLAVTLYPNHVRAVEDGGTAHASIEFPALPLQAPLPLLAKSSIHFSWDPLLERCDVRVQ